MIKITRFQSEDSSPVRFQVEGRIDARAGAELERICEAEGAGRAPVVVDLAGVAFVDRDGAHVVQALIREGVVVLGCSPLVDEILRAHATRGEEDDAGGDEADLIAALRRGEDTAFAELVRAHGGRMLSVARRMLRIEEEAHDAVQEAFVSAFKAIDRFEGGARLSTWLHRITVNAALMRLRRRKRKPEESIDALLPNFDATGAWTEEPVEWSLPDQQAERQETRAIVRACIERMPESYRMILLLRDIEELDTDETATALGLTASAVKARLHRARQALRSILEQRLGTSTPGRSRDGAALRDAS